jgi:DNA (cytosine-5)-methyltransferase 1
VRDKRKQKMKFISLFAGIGGFDLGLERAGMQCIGQVEYNPFCQRVLKKHWPHVKLVGDIHDVTADSFGAAELICGGFPCQPFSVAGNRKGAEDDRFLWPEMLRVIQAYRPTWIVGENVTGIINMELDNVLSQLESNGYTVQTFIIPACAVDAKHRRDRVWIVAYSQCVGQSGSGTDVRSYNTTQDSKREADRLDDIGQVWPDEAEWFAQSGMGRISNGVPNRTHRLKGLGNAIVPQVAMEIMRNIALIEKSEIISQTGAGCERLFPR